MMDGFFAALRWHKAVIATSPTAQSVYYTRTILRELNASIELLKKVNTEEHPHEAEVEAFLANHHLAPYTE